MERRMSVQFTEAEFNKKLRLYVEEVQDIIDEKYADSTAAQGTRRPTVHTTNGKKYIKIVKEVFGSTSVWGFVCKQSGHIYKAASWKTPAKKPRGNLFDSFRGLRFVDWAGPMYLDGIDWQYRHRLDRGEIL